MAIARVRQRVALGGHDVPEDVIRRRFHAGLSNFQEVYKPLVDEWVLYDNSGNEPVRLDEGYKS
jgi:predicted ABC-type ATPase